MRVGETWEWIGRESFRVVIQKCDINGVNIYIKDDDNNKQDYLDHLRSFGDYMDTSEYVMSKNILPENSWWVDRESFIKVYRKVY